MMNIIQHIFQEPLLTLGIPMKACNPQSSHVHDEGQPLEVHDVQKTQKNLIATLKALQRTWHYDLAIKITDTK